MKTGHDVPEKERMVLLQERIHSFHEKSDPITTISNMDGALIEL